MAPDPNGLNGDPNGEGYKSSVHTEPCPKPCRVVAIPSRLRARLSASAIPPARAALLMSEAFALPPCWIRVVALDAETVKVLRTHKAQQAAERLEWGEAWINTGRVFAEVNGTLLHPGKVSEAFEKIVKTSSLPPIRLHDLRHGAATLALAGGADMKTVQEMLGTRPSRSRRTSTRASSPRSLIGPPKRRPSQSRASPPEPMDTLRAHEARGSAALQLVTNLEIQKDPGQEA